MAVDRSAERASKFHIFTSVWSVACVLVAAVLPIVIVLSHR